MAKVAKQTVNEASDVYQLGVPQVGWQLEKIEGAIRACVKINLRAAWVIGKSVLAAKPHFERGGWMEWATKACEPLSWATIDRYAKLAEGIPESEVDCMSISRAYHLLGITKPARKSKGEQVAAIENGIAKPMGIEGKEAPNSSAEEFSKLVVILNDVLTGLTCGAKQERDSKWKSLPGDKRAELRAQLTSAKDRLDTLLKELPAPLTESLGVASPDIGS
jgi:hypothetical protein